MQIYTLHGTKLQICSIFFYTYEKLFETYLLCKMDKPTTEFKNKKNEYHTKIMHLCKKRPASRFPVLSYEKNLTDHPTRAKVVYTLSMHYVLRKNTRNW